MSAVLECTTLPVDKVAAIAKKTLIDVRTPAEFEAVHAAGAINIPLTELTAEKATAAGEGPYYILCKSGGRARMACNALAARGVETVVVAGGTDAWLAAGLPHVRGEARGIPLERQTLIGAGVVVLTGLALGTFINPWFYLISAFAGCGLLVAGFTGFCLMAIILGRMPWNSCSRRA